MQGKMTTDEALLYLQEAAKQYGWQTRLHYYGANVPSNYIEIFTDEWVTVWCGSWTQEYKQRIIAQAPSDVEHVLRRVHDHTSPWTPRDLYVPIYSTPSGPIR